MQVLGGDLPLRAVARDVLNLGAVANGHAALHHCIQVLTGQCAVVDVGAVIEPANSHRVVEVATLSHQRHGFSELLFGIAELHVREQWVVLQSLVTSLEVVHLLHTVSERHVRHGINELGRVSQYPLFHQVGPELAGHLELLVDAHSLGDINLATHFRRVVEFTQSGVAGTRVVPRVRGLCAGNVQTLDNHLAPVRLELLQHHRQGGGNDARADEQDINRVFITRSVT